MAVAGATAGASADFASVATMVAQLVAVVLVVSFPVTGLGQVAVAVFKTGAEKIGVWMAKRLMRPMLFTLTLRSSISGTRRLPRILARTGIRLATVCA